MIGQFVVALAWLFVGVLIGISAVVLVCAWKRPQVRPRDWKQTESFDDPPAWLKWIRINGDYR